MRDRHTSNSLFLSPAVRHQPAQVGIAPARETTLSGDNRRWAFFCP